MVIVRLVMSDRRGVVEVEMEIDLRHNIQCLQCNAVFGGVKSCEGPAKRT